MDCKYTLVMCVLG